MTKNASRRHFGASWQKTTCEDFLFCSGEERGTFECSRIDTDVDIV
jgi:hypothetical protein